MEHATARQASPTPEVVGDLETLHKAITEIGGRLTSVRQSLSATFESIYGHASWSNTTPESVDASSPAEGYHTYIGREIGGVLDVLDHLEQTANSFRRLTG